MEPRTIGSSPHTRGARDGRGRVDLPLGIIPAYAGSTALNFSVLRASMDHPRIRGEHSPTPSGITRRERIIPAYAGSTTSSIRWTRSRWDHPRIRGEHRRRAPLGRHAGGSSPHTRGAHLRQDWLLLGAGIIPAYAGSTPGPDRVVRDGDGSSPHTRGARPGSLQRRGFGGIIPAYAGSTPRSRPQAPETADHPRIRGEHVVGIAHGPVRGRIIPAYAGSTGIRTRSTQGAWDHPRIRGEHAERHQPKGNFTGSSPHTRGAPSKAYGTASRAGIIPAYAGSTPVRSSSRTSWSDHPRIRGEHGP